MDIGNKSCVYAYNRPTSDQGTHAYRLKSEGMENDNPCKWKLKEKAEVATLISDKNRL